MTICYRWIPRCLVAVAILGSAPRAKAEEPAVGAPPPVPPPPPSGPTVGGHLGIAIPIATIASTSTAIGADFVTIGITPGISVNLDKHWTIDFEFIALNELKNTPAATTFVVDPGVVRHFDAFALGLRLATQVGSPTNVGLVPNLRRSVQDFQPVLLLRRRRHSPLPA